MKKPTQRPKVSGMHHDLSKPHAVDVLSQEEIAQLVRSYARGKTCILEADLLKLVEWARDVKLQQVLLDLVMAGQVEPIVQDGALCLIHRARRPLVCGCGLPSCGDCFPV